MPETSNAKGWCGDHGAVHDDGIVAGDAVGKSACFDDHEFFRMIAPRVEVLDPEAHLDCGMGILEWMSLVPPVGLESAG